MNTGLILDHKSQILDKRNAGLPASYIPKHDKRRIESNSVLNYYYLGDSSSAITELADSLRETWTDPAPVYLLASTFATLTTLGMRLIIDKADEKIQKKIQKKLRRGKFYRKIREAARFASAFGDGIIEIVYDNKLKSPKLNSYHPSCFQRISDDEVILYWSDEDHPEEIYVKHYLKALIGKKVEKGVLINKLSEKVAIGLREGWVPEVQLTHLGNEIPLQDRFEPGHLHKPLPGLTEIPVISLPNGDDDVYGFGVSDFWNVLGLIDNWVQIISDQKAQSLFLIPPIFTHGEKAPGKMNEKTGNRETEYEPHQLYHLGENGGVDVPDFANMMKAGNIQKDVVWNSILGTIGLAKAMLGDVGEVSNRRDREVRLMYMPGQTKIKNRREDYLPYFDDIKDRMHEIWTATDKKSYQEVFGSINLKELEFGFDDILPADIKERVETINSVQDRAGFDKETYTRELVNILGIDGNAEEITKKAAAESKLENGF